MSEEHRQAEDQCRGAQPRRAARVAIGDTRPGDDAPGRGVVLGLEVTSVAGDTEADTRRRTRGKLGHARLGSPVTREGDQAIGRWRGAHGERAVSEGRWKRRAGRQRKRKAGRRQKIEEGWPEV
jgi:hypothetical protein